MWAIGNLTKDRKEGIDSIYWNVYGKITQISKNDGTVIKYGYDAAGNRISKTVGTKQTLYVRDASGNVMSIYTAGIDSVNSGHLTQSEVHLYGSSRLGMLTPNTDMTVNQTMPGIGSKYFTTFIRGTKFFEITNHLGNVLATVTDKKMGVRSTTDTSKVAYYTADVMSAQDYYPFGMQMPGRTFTGTTSYRYGFNGKENDNEISGAGNKLDFGARIYDSRLGRWLSRDPLAEKYPNASPYNFALNNPVAAIDPDGKLVIFVNGYRLAAPVANVIREFKRDDKITRTDVHEYWSGVDKKFMDRMGDHNSIYADGDAPTLTAKNQSSFNARMAHGQKAGKDLIAKINSSEVVLQKNDAGEVIESIKLVTHSMGYAYSLGMQKELEKAGYKVEVSYNLAPENPTAGNIPSIVKRSVQNGSGPDDPWYYQDRIAPQERIKNVNERAVMPDKNDAGDNIPKGPYDSHAVENYGKWIFDNRGKGNGDVLPRQDTQATDHK